MKKKVLAATLLAGALMVAPIGSGLTSAVAVASENNTVNNTVNNSASGNNTVNNSTSNTSSSSAASASTQQDEIENQVINAESGAVVELEGVTTLSNSVMHQLVERGDVSMVLRYTYEGVDYVVTIPAGAAIDSDIPWYGPLYLASRFGNGATGAAGASYTVKAGDTMSKIARANGMTLAQLSAKNPQISDVNRISVGQKINLK